MRMPSVILLSVFYVECHNKVHNSECHNSECHNAECHNSECHYAECHYAECRGATLKYSLLGQTSGLWRKA